MAFGLPQRIWCILDFARRRGRFLCLEPTCKLVDRCPQFKPFRLVVLAIALIKLVLSATFRVEALQFMQRHQRDAVLVVLNTPVARVKVNAELLVRLLQSSQVLAPKLRFGFRFYR